MRNLYIGLDPGKSGFITVFDGKNFDFYQMPEEKVKTGKFLKSGKPQTKSVFSENKLREIVFHINEKYKGFKKYACIEEVTGREGWSANNNFNFGLVAGLQRMVLIMLGCDIIRVRPTKWQSFIRQGYKEIKKPSSTGKTMVLDAKAIAEMIVEKEYPHIDFRKSERSRKNDDNKIDSFLICLYLYRVMNS